MQKFSKHTGILLSISLMTGIVAGALPAQARDDLVMISISDTLASPEAKDLFDGSVKFYFGDTAHPAIIKKIGSYTANERTNSFGKPAEIACTRAMLSSLVKLQNRARQLGATAVINIHSYYRKADFSSDTQVQCYEGFLMAGVTLRGDIVTTSAH